MEETMGVMDTLLNWIAPFLDPMNDFHIHANDMNGVHSNSIQSFQSSLDELQAKQALQRNTIISGQAGNAMTNLGMDFSQTELDLTNMAFEINKLSQITEKFTECVSNIMGSVEIAAAKLEGDEVLTEITADVDIAAVAEGGFNPIADVLGLILTIIDGAILIDTIKQLADDIQADIQALTSDLNNLQNVVYPATAPQPYANTIQPDWKKNPHNVDPNDLATLQNLYGSKFNANAQLQATFQTVMQELLQMGLTKDQITQIMNALLATGCSPADILLFLQGVLNSNGGYPNSPSPDALVARILSLSRGTENQANLKALVELYAQVANIPGASRLLERLMTASFGPTYNGYLYELQWCVAHKDTIARIEDVTLVDGQVKQAADVVMKSGPFTQGAIVDTKSYKVSSLITETDNLIKQIKKDQGDYPGYPIVLVFDSKKLLDSNGHLLPGAANVFAQLKEAGATVMTSPPDKVWEEANPDLPAAHTTPARLAQSAAAVATNAITSGQTQTSPQQLPPQEQPPQQLPPMQMPPQK
jgi:hypothetical protein